MIICIDIETTTREGIDARTFLTGCIIKEHTKKPEHYLSKEDLWKRVLELGYSEAKHKRTLSVYSHNASFDSAGYINLNDKHLVFFRERPFIWKYRLTEKECEKNNIPHTKGRGKDIITFLDTTNIYGMPLEELGRIICLLKQETPLHLLEKERISKEELKEIQRYNVRDTEILMKSLKIIKKKIKEEKARTRRIYTINQIAISILIQKMKALPKEYTDPLFWDTKKGEVRRTFREEEISQSSRGAINQAYQTGTWEKVTELDCNSLYPYSATKIKFPDLRSERKWEHEEGDVFRKITGSEEKEERAEKRELRKLIYIAQCLLYNRENERGSLPVRTGTGNYYPTKGQYLLGTWTKDELEYALTHGYEEIFTTWMVTWEEAPNALEPIMEELFKKRKGSQTAFDDYFYKQMMNSGIGKFSQNKPYEETVLDNVDKCEEYKKNMYKVIRGIGTKYMYKKTEGIYRGKWKEGTRKPYYAPILYSLITAKARTIMQGFYDFIPKEDLLYTDTDNIIFTGNHKDKFPIGEGMGQFKIKKDKFGIPKENVPCIIFCRKNYCVASDVKISGVNKTGMNREKFSTGEIENKKMITIRTMESINEVGKFITEKRNLKKQQEDHEFILEEYRKQDLLIDASILESEDAGQQLEAYLPYLKKISECITPVIQNSDKKT